MNCVSCSHNCKPLLPHPVYSVLGKDSCWGEIEHEKRDQESGGGAAILNREDGVGLMDKVTSEHSLGEGQGSKQGVHLGGECFC